MVVEPSSSRCASSTHLDNFTTTKKPREKTGSWSWTCQAPAFCVVRCRCCNHTWERQVECGDRSCPGCRHHRALAFGIRWEKALETWDGGVFGSLTWPNQMSMPTKKDIDECRGKWAKFWRSKTVRKWLLGGWYAIECTKTENGYNLHIHFMMRTHYRVNEQMKRQIRWEWQVVEPRSKWIHLSNIRNKRHARNYLVAEIGKGSDVVLPKGCRLVQRVGDVGGKPAPPLGRCPECESEDLEVMIEAWEYARMGEFG